MLDKKTIAVLKALNKLADGSAYKVVTSDEIIMSLTQKSQYDADTVRQIIEFLEKQEYLNIKFSEENTYCFSLLPKARIYLEQETTKNKTKKHNFPVMIYVYTMISAFVGTMIALLIFFYLTF
ncbi:MAG: hypothetical protein IKM43_02335 [Clostridia bacterium]|nr:hypothetical protein [Clostridia bacterium]